MRVSSTDTISPARTRVEFITLADDVKHHCLPFVNATDLVALARTCRRFRVLLGDAHAVTEILHAWLQSLEQDLGWLCDFNRLLLCTGCKTLCRSPRSGPIVETATKYVCCESPLLSYQSDYRPSDVLVQKLCQDLRAVFVDVLQGFVQSHKTATSAWMMLHDANVVFNGMVREIAGHIRAAPIQFSRLHLPTSVLTACWALYFDSHNVSSLQTSPNSLSNGMVGPFCFAGPMTLPAFEALLFALPRSGVTTLVLSRPSRCIIAPARDESIAESAQQFESRIFRLALRELRGNSKLERLALLSGFNANAHAELVQDLLAVLRSAPSLKAVCAAKLDPVSQVALYDYLASAPCRDSALRLYSWDQERSIDVPNDTRTDNQQDCQKPDDLGAFIRILLRNTTMSVLPIPYPLTVPQLSALAGAVRVSPSRVMRWDVMAGRFHSQHWDFLYDSYEEFVNVGDLWPHQLKDSDSKKSVYKVLQKIRNAREQTCTEEAWSSRHKACVQLFRVLLARAGIEDIDLLPESEILVNTAV